MEGMARLAPLRDEGSKVSPIGRAAVVEVEFSSTPVGEKDPDVTGIHREVAVAVRKTEQSSGLGLSQSVRLRESAQSDDEAGDGGKKKGR